MIIEMPKEEAEQLSHSISDLLCWVRGFEAALSMRPDPPDVLPFGTQELRSFNLKLKSALRKEQ